MRVILVRDLERLQQLDPEAAAWWLKRRREMWREVGLTRPLTYSDIAEVKAVAREVMSNVRRAFETFQTGIRDAAKAFVALGNTNLTPSHQPSTTVLAPTGCSECGLDPTCGTPYARPACLEAKKKAITA